MKIVSSKDIFSGKIFKVLKKRDSICGNRIWNHIKHFIGPLLLISIAAFILYLFLQMVGLADSPGNAEQTVQPAAMYFAQPMAEQTAESDDYDPKDILESLFSFLTIAATLYTSMQIYLMKDINRTEMSHEIYKDDQQYRMQAEKAKNEMNTLFEIIKRESITPESEKFLLENGDESKFHNILLSKDFKTLRSFAYHYEYIGYLTLRDKLNFDVAFDTITFPNWLISSKKAKVIIEIGRVYTPDFWNGSEYLYCSYEVRRKYNALAGFKNLPAREKSSDRKAELKQKYKTVCKAWEEKCSQLI